MSHIVWFDFFIYKMTRIYKFRETENKLMIARGWELRGWKVTGNWYGISFEGDENYLKLIVEIVVQLCDYIKNCVVYS